MSVKVIERQSTTTDALGGYVPSDLPYFYDRELITELGTLSNAIQALGIVYRDFSHLSQEELIDKFDTKDGSKENMFFLNQIEIAFQLKTVEKLTEEEAAHEILYRKKQSEKNLALMRNKYPQLGI